jgi:hypothetical protein
MSTQSVTELERKMAEFKLRMPPHSILPAMLLELEELEKAREAEKEG